MQRDWLNNRIPALPSTVRFGSSSSTPFVIWLTGLSGAGKTTLADIVCRQLQAMAFPVRHLDGDNIRALTPNLGFTKPERVEHIRNVAVLASRLEREGACVVVSLISPYREARAEARALCRNFVEVYVSTPLDECVRRDVKGLYKRAISGEIPHFTGISSPYEPPVRPNLAIDTLGVSPQSCAALILNHVRPYLFGGQPEVEDPKAS